LQLVGYDLENHHYVLLNFHHFVSWFLFRGNHHQERTGERWVSKRAARNLWSNRHLPYRPGSFRVDPTVFQ
ncbi:MAG: hypothetical protein IK124_04450, partial [Prevotella sp.]|nr:hypothetical protein [Prevotella sp.]